MSIYDQVCKKLTKAVTRQLATTVSGVCLQKQDVSVTSVAKFIRAS